VTATDVALPPALGASNSWLALTCPIVPSAVDTRLRATVIARQGIFMGCGRHAHVDARSRLARCVLKNTDSGSAFSLRIREEAVPSANPAHRGVGIVERQAEAYERQVVLTRTLPGSPTERGKLLQTSTRTRSRSTS
jgi:hypothetical protein